MRKVLIVEDAAIVAFHLKCLLEQNNLQVVNILSSGENVLETFKQYDPDVILMDIMLDGQMTGIEAAQIIRQVSKIPIVFMSALTDELSKLSINTIENTRQVAKPFNESDLLKTIRALINPVD